ncbi:hypothetical protein SK128_001476 [Halocaridina rubra]|uniref:Uncharacterized protein n=1 Tax=Halocaridina rubra TaxID=373956 RepID=A0AAN8X9P0_HALRR
MANSVRSVATCCLGLGVGVFDLLHAFATLIFYGYELVTHYRCHWNHGIRWCQYYIYQTNHSVRVNIGIGEGIVCLLFASLLIVGFCKYKPWLTWMWLVKALAVIVVNSYFICVWLIERSRYYHSFWDRNNYDQDNIFLLAGVGLTIVEFFIMIIFCCVSGVFTYRVSPGHPFHVPSTSRSFPLSDVATGQVSYCTRI